ncbi:PREDICTED: eukaryotic translation initiation factor 2-alpha kinase 3-like [Poecilia mexicana]|uniref:eukaryotic translation initiation factor 2-alpha kinase 3-like n=1 Tax=Poecilia mexicana TaxID=48701 RepID=UPI00072EB799|nr:PREDICTED: eukaryotic translation initiation factor 2-alpha kinase 3-like [Poecilia mexicana]XP_014835092.1 PREDICTED: eukaryotic translation initiation factor 2-alpha kinase 3-like [Poecilia mexicana]XP_014835542.1 PREDICTED: eukaryotic translation initiation factor 2-alpha kinase 3-like [Poecilia mexicana]
MLSQVLYSISVVKPLSVMSLQGLLTHRCLPSSFQTLTEVRALRFPELFSRNNAEELTMVRSMLSPSPSERPEAADITAMSLFQELELPCRLAVRQRSRTYSSSSMGRPARQASSS